MKPHDWPTDWLHAPMYVCVQSPLSPFTGPPQGYRQRKTKWVLNTIIIYHYYYEWVLRPVLDNSYVPPRCIVRRYPNDANMSHYVTMILLSHCILLYPYLGNATIDPCMILLLIQINYYEWMCNWLIYDIYLPFPSDGGDDVNAGRRLLWYYSNTTVASYMTRPLRLFLYSLPCRSTRR